MLLILLLLLLLLLFTEYIEALGNNLSKVTQRVIAKQGFKPKWPDSVACVPTTPFVLRKRFLEVAELSPWYFKRISINPQHYIFLNKKIILKKTLLAHFAETFTTLHSIFATTLCAL